MSKTVGYCLVLDPQGRAHVGIVTDDRRIRVDYFGPLTDLVPWAVDFEDEKNPWVGQAIFRWPIRHHTLDYT